MGKIIFERKPLSLLGDQLKNQFNPNKLRSHINMADKTIVCRDCNSEFIFNESEQAFYKEKGFENEPQRCAGCREAKKQQRNSGGNRGGNRSFGGGNRW